MRTVTTKFLTHHSNVAMYLAAFPARIRRRKQIRFPLLGSVGFRWRDDSGICHYGKGQSRDISEHGVFVETQVCPPLGALTKAEIQIRRSHNAASSNPIALEGCVIRVERRGKDASCTGFAMRTLEAFFSDIDCQLPLCKEKLV
jgi:hypothetical protein